MKIKPLSSVTAVFSLLACFALGNPLSFPSYTQTLQVSFASEQDAKNAQLVFAPLPDGKKVAFTTRWDDSNFAHVDKAKMLNEAGYFGTFFLNGSTDFLKKASDKILPGNNAFGNHSSSHPMLMEVDTATVFREILANRKRIETMANTTVISFAMPYNWVSKIDPARPFTCAETLIQTGHFVSADGPLGTPSEKPLPGKTLPPKPDLLVFMPTHVFSADDTAPKAERFNKGFEKSFSDALKNAKMPRLTFGIHSWCKADGNKLQSELLKARGGNPDIFYCNDNEYGAYRYSALYGTAEKSQKKANCQFNLTRYYPALLGDDVPLSISFTAADGSALTPSSVTLNGKTLTRTSRGFYTLPHSAAYTMPAKVYAADSEGLVEALPGLKFAVRCEDNFLRTTIQNKSDTPLKNLHIVSYPTPTWTNAKGRYSDSLAELTPGKTITKVYSLGTQIPELTTLTPEYYAAQFDFTMADGKVYRVWCDFTAPDKPVVKAAKQETLTPQRAALTLGPFESSLLTSEQIAELAKPDAVLPNLGLGLNQYWRSQANPKGAPWSVNSFIPWEQDKNFMNAIRDILNNKKAKRLIAFDFYCEEACNVELRTNLLHYKENSFWLNGEGFRKKGYFFTLPAQKGWNRLIINNTPENAYHACSFLAAVFLPNGDFAPCRVPATEQLPNIFDSDELSGEFNPSGEIHKLSYKGKHLLDFASFYGEVSYKNAEDKMEKVNWSQNALGKKNVKFQNSAESNTCTTSFPIKDKQGNEIIAFEQSITLAKNTVTIAHKMTLLKDLAWTGKLLETRLQYPAKLLSPAIVSGTMNNKAFSRSFKAAYDNSHNIGNITDLKIVSEAFPPLRLAVENANLTQILDRRQWKQNTFSMQFHPKGAIQYGNTPRSDVAGKVYSWKLTLEIPAAE